MTNQGNQSAMQYYPVPRLRGQEHLETPIPTPDSPAVLSYIIRVRGNEDDGTPRDLLYFYIGRDRAMALSSFTIAYRFSALPVMMDDPAHPFYAYEYTDADINDDNEYIVCKFSIPPQRSDDVTGCGAFVSGVTFPDGTAYTFDAGEFTYSDRDMQSMTAVITAEYDSAMEYETPDTDTGSIPADTSPQNDEDDTFDALEAARIGQEAARRKRRRAVRIAGYALLAAGALTLSTVGVQYLSYQSAMLGAQVYLDAGEYRQAQNYIEEEIGGNLFSNSRRNALSATLKQLCAEERYNEAYRIASLAPYADLMQSVCREASDKALAAGDYETAYVYAAGAPDSFADEVTAAAAAVILDPYAGTMNESAYRVAQKSSDTKALDDLYLSMVRDACGQNHYHTAMRAAMEISDGETCAATVADVFGIATRYYINRGSYKAAADFITLYSSDDNTVDADVEAALISYFSESRDADSAFFLAKQFGIAVDDIHIDAEDSAVREDLSGTYHLLSADQKRAYHAQRITATGILFTVGDDGCVTLSATPSGVTPADGKDTSMTDAQKRVNDLLGGKKVVSVLSGGLTTAFLHTDGSVTMISNRIIGGTVTAAGAEELSLIAAAEKLSDVVAMAAGDEHFVFLHDDGTVSCIGDNSHGQCGTTGSKWTDIVAVAAGKNFTVGLHSDGTVTAVGSDDCGECDVSGFANVVDVAACDQTTVVLFADGTAGIRGERSMGIADTLRLTGIRRIRAGGSAVIAELSDGSYAICGAPAETGNYGSTASWHDVTDFNVGSVCAAAIDGDGVTRTTGTNKAKT